MVERGRSVVLLTREGREHVYVANRLAQEFDIAATLVDRGPVTRGPGSEVRRLKAKYTPTQMAERVVLSSWRFLGRGRRDARLRSVLGPQSDVFSGSHRLHFVDGLNHRGSLEILDRVRPDLILVYGTGIIRDRVLDKGRIGALNMHTGTSPEYRGSDCAFWPLHDGALDLLGATVHECTAKVDGGAILARERATLEAEDGVDEIFARCVLAGTAVYGRCAIQVLERGEIRGEPQVPGEGREFRSAMRGIRAEWSTRRSIARGSVRRFVQQTQRRTHDSACG